MTRAELAGDRLDLDAGRGFRAFEAGGGKPSPRKEPLCHADAADLEGFDALGLEPAADDEFGRPAADVDDQTWLERARQLVRDAEINQARFFVPADDVDRKSKGVLGLRQKLACVFCHAKRIGRDCAHRRRVQAGEPFAEAREALKRGLHRRGFDATLCIEAGAEAQRFAPGVEPVDLIAFDATDLEPEAVRAQVDDGERGGGRGGHECPTAADGQG